MKTTVSEELVRDVDHAMRVLDSIKNLRGAVTRAGSCEDLVEHHLDKSLREFIETVAAPNGIRFHSDSKFAAGVGVREAPIREVLEALEYLKKQSSL